ncbi:vasopressin V2 receptor isoform X1 [Betta splendens]|uniref:Vasopressin V2 receptor isoform X1 n=1 Tax=Betta splendens TaxID=158456 RepID=A0A6P7N0G4_BETSP|nr:vasopressin V2 receptor isoform X1 [Betta splendens]XP_029012911.1 vasopressin V2 receptor isoform X1 [Betta splendens]
MERLRVQTGWDGPGLSSPLASGGTNATPSSLLASGLRSLNASVLGLFPENASAFGPTPRSLPKAAVRDPGLARAEIAVLAMVLALTTLGNGFVLWVLLRRRKHNAPMHVFMVNLAVADLVVGLFQVFPQLIWDITERFQGPDFLCRTIKYLQIVGMFASSYMIVAMTVDRHHAICCPLKAYRGGAVSRWNPPVMVAWALALVLSLPQVFIFSRSEVAPGVYECWGHFAEAWGLKAYVTWMTVAVLFLPALIITVCQIRIFREIHNNIYLKSERLVKAEMKRNEILFCFPGFREADERSKEGGRRVSGGGGGGRDGRGDQLLRAANSSPHSYAHGRECYDYASPSVQYNSSRGELVAPAPGGSDRQGASSDPASGSRRCSLEGAPPQPPAAPPPSITRAMSKTVRMTLVIVLVYTVCWAPFFIVQLWAAWAPDPPKQGVAFTILMLLASLNSCTNPWIYTAFSSSISRELLSLARCRSGPGRRGSLPDDSTATHTSTTKDSLY